MSTTVEPVTDDAPVLDDEQSLPDARVLEDKTPEWMRTPGISVWFVFALGVLMVTLFSSRPLWPTDLWDHVNHGTWILNHGHTPGAEPLLTLTGGVPMVSSAWLAQVGFASLFQWQGFAGLQFVYGLLVVLSLGMVAWGGVRRSGSAVFGFVALFACLALNWHQLLVIRPQLVGLVLFSGLVTWLLSVRKWYAANWLLIPLVFTVWANTHGSFAVGLVTLTLAGGAHAATILVRTRSLSAAIRSPRFLRLFLLTQLCAMASLLNPAGLALFHEVVRVGRHPNISSMFEWDPLTLRMKQGQAAAVLGLALLVVLRWSPRRLRADEAVLLIFTGGMTLWSSRMINWLAPVMALTLAAHGAAVWRLWRSRRRCFEPRKVSGLWTLVSVLLCWVFFAFTTLGVQVVHGRQVPMQRAVTPQTPVGAADFLNSVEELPPGVVFCSAEWAGFLQKFVTHEFRPMVNLHVHVIPEEIWTHYLQLAAGPSDWKGLADLYGIHLAVVDKTRHPRLLQQIRKDTSWEPLFEDAQAVVFQRTERIP